MYLKVSSMLPSEPPSLESSHYPSLFLSMIPFDFPSAVPSDIPSIIMYQLTFDIISIRFVSFDTIFIYLYLFHIGSTFCSFELYHFNLINGIYLNYHPWYHLLSFRLNHLMIAQFFYFPSTVSSAFRSS